MRIGLRYGLLFLSAPHFDLYEVPNNVWIQTLVAK